MSAPASISGSDRRAQIPLPFAEKEWVDLARTMRILGAAKNTIYRLRRMSYSDGTPFLDVIDYGNGRRQRVLYSSIVRYCEHLRERYAIPDRRPQLENAIFRHRDEDLLPFPLADTIFIEQALPFTLYESPDSLRYRCEEGAFWAYQILPLPGSLWRISRTDFARWVQESRNRVRR